MKSIKNIWNTGYFIYFFIESPYVDWTFMYATKFYCSRAMLVNQNYIVYINMKQDADRLKKTQVGAVRCMGSGPCPCSAFKHDCRRIYKFTRWEL